MSIKRKTEKILDLHKARRIIANDKLGRNIINWNVPADLEKYAKKNEDGTLDRFDTIIGFGRFKNNNKLFLAILSGGHLHYFSDEVLDVIVKSFNKLNKLNNKVVK